jgi:DNA-binding MarR family transcriptional regulator
LTLYVYINILFLVSSEQHLPFAITVEVRDTCLCLHLERAARAVARRFDAALRPLSLTNGQFSLLMSLNREDAPSIGNVSALLAMDRTTMTANLKPLERRGMVRVTLDDADKRTRRLRLTSAGRALLVAAVPIWRDTHAAIEDLLPRSNRDKLRADLRALA